MAFVLRRCESVGCPAGIHPQSIGYFLWKLRTEDINDKRHIVKAHFSDSEGLMDWLNDGKGKTEQ